MEVPRRAALAPSDGPASSVRELLPRRALLWLGFAALGVVGTVWAIHDEHEARHAALEAAHAAAERASRVHTLHGEILRLDELLTSAARLAAATGDPRWRVRYATQEPTLARAIDEAAHIGATFSGVAAMSRTDRANRALVAIEAEVFAHVARGELAEASALLDGERYATLKAAYADGMSAFLAQLDQAADAVEAEQRGAVERSWPRVWLVVGSLVASWALMFGGVVRSEHARAAAEARLAREREAWAASRRGAAPAPVLADASRPDGPPPDGARASSPSLDPGGLPVLAPESATALLLERLRTRAAPLRVLVVEDNAANRIVATAMLRTFEKVATTVAVDGFAALEAITEARFDVVLMDIHMPELDGLETTRRLRALGGEAARTPVIAMTASAFDSDVAACAAAGLEGFLAKPYRREELAAALLPWVTIVHDDAT